ncbi:MAG: CAP domain-containing protein [Myxococcota bacterium]
MRTALLLFSVLLAGCAGKPCDASTCAGCCDSSGACVEAPAVTACGLGGAACVSCASGQLCVDGACRTSGVGGGGGGGGTSLEPWQQEILTAHNQVRNNASPTPSPALPALSWNPQAQAFAQAWVDGCDFRHNPNTRNTWGENIFASSGVSTPTEVVSNWASEASDYNYATNTCAAGQACGHYTQIVWRATTSVGCARRECTVNNPFGGGSWWFWVCDYAPPGNVVGQKPY